MSVDGVINMRNTETGDRDPLRLGINKEKLEATEFDSAKESMWSKVVREANLLSNSSAKGISDSLHDLATNPGKAVIASGMGLAMSAPLMLLSCKYRVLRPIADLIGIGGAALFATSELKKLGGIGGALTNLLGAPRS